MKELIKILYMAGWFALTLFCTIHFNMSYQDYLGIAVIVLVISVGAFGIGCSK